MSSTAGGGEGGSRAFEQATTMFKRPTGDGFRSGRVAASGDDLPALQGKSSCAASTLSEETMLFLAFAREDKGRRLWLWITISETVGVLLEI
jgi:hypothetical protein